MSGWVARELLELLSMAIRRNARSTPVESEDSRRTGHRFRTRALTDGEVTPTESGPGHSFLGSTVNISIGGALVRTYEALTDGIELNLTLHLPEGDLQTIGRVMHVKEDAVGCCLAGVRFEALDEASKELIERHLAAFGGIAPTVPAAELVPVEAQEPVQATDEEKTRAPGWYFEARHRAFGTGQSDGVKDDSPETSPDAPT